MQVTGYYNDMFSGEKVAVTFNAPFGTAPKSTGEIGEIGATFTSPSKLSYDEAKTLAQWLQDNNDGLVIMPGGIVAGYVKFQVNGHECVIFGA